MKPPIALFEKKSDIVFALKKAKVKQKIISTVVLLA